MHPHALLSDPASRFTVTVGGVLKTKKSAALGVASRLKVASATPCEGPAPSASHINVWVEAVDENTNCP